MNKGLIKEFVGLNVYWLLSLPFLCLLLFSDLSYHSAAFSFITMGYFCLLALAQAALLSWLCLVLIPAVIWLFSFRKIPPLPIAVFLSTLLLYFLLLDVFIYSQIRSHFDWSLFQMILSPARTQIFNPTFMDYTSLLLVLAAIIFLQVVLLRCLRVHAGRLGQCVLRTQFVFLLLILLTQGVYLWADAVYEPKLLMATELIPCFHGVTAKRFLAAHALINPGKRPINRVVATHGNLVYPLNPIISLAKEKKFNIVMIAIDSWRADSMDRLTTPHIADFTAIANVYKKHFSGGNSTRSGMFSLFYSVSPSQFNAFYQLGRGPVLFEILKQQHYRQAAFTSASGVSPPFHRTIFIDLPDFQLTSPGGSSVERDQYITGQANDFIDNNYQQPFFLFAFYDSAHAYDYPEKDAPFQPCEHVSHLSVHGEEQQILTRNQYRNALHFIDQEVAKILDNLNSKGLLDNTLVLITSDHGEEFDDNGLGVWGHNSNFTPAQTQVPLIIHWPRQRAGQIYHHTTSHFDIIPTLFKEILGVKNPLSDYSLGRLLSDSSSREIILMASYSNLAVFSPIKKQLAVSNRLGYFQMQNIHGTQTDALLVDSSMLSLAYQQMHHFVDPVNVAQG